MTQQEIKDKQPTWCNYEDAARPMWGCESLLHGLVNSPDDCKECELNKKNMIKYEVDKRNRSITFCPYGMLDFEDKIKMVGSRDCSACLYCFDIDKKKHFVVCAAKTSTTYNISKL